MSVHRYDDHPGSKHSEDIPELGLAHSLGVYVMVSSRAIDQYIDQHGLRPVVNEVKRRRWAIMMGLALFAALR